jgi:hypothetical protein
MMHHDALLPTALPRLLETICTARLSKPLSCFIVLSALLPVVYQHVNNRSTEYNFRMTSYVESDSGDSGLGSIKDKHKNRARVPAVVRWGAKKKTGGVTKSTNGGKTPKVGKTKGGKKVAQEKRHQREQLKDKEKDDAEALAAAMEEEEEKERRMKRRRRKNTSLGIEPR